MTVKIITLGCKVNQYESQAMLEALLAAGFTQAAPDEAAGVVVVNSCTVTAQSDHKVRQALRRAKKDNPGAVTVLTGCMPQAFPDAAAALLEADIVLGNTKRSDLVPRLQEFLATKQRVGDIAPHVTGEPFEPLHVSEFHGRTRAFLKIQDGCDRFCAYCIIPYARGRVRSKALEDIRQEVAQLGQAGYKEVVLTGINLPAYGKELGLHLCDAVEAACEATGIQRVRLGSLEPEQLTPEVIARMASQDKLCPQFHLSLQSGCDATLRRMNRHYTTAEYGQIVGNLREAFPGCAITTDVMVGFAGETEEEFEASLSFVRKIGFSKVHVFAYSRRPGTRAYDMPDQVTVREKEDRSHRMIKATRATQQAFLQAQLGQAEEVLFEQQKEQCLWEGYTRNYTHVLAPSGRDLSGQLVQVRLESVQGESCVGKIEKVAEAGKGGARLASGAVAADESMVSLNNGLNLLEEESSALPAAASALDEGTDVLSDGAQNIAQGLDSLSGGVNDLQAGADALSAGFNTITGEGHAQSAQLRAGAAAIENALSEISSRLTEEDGGAGSGEEISGLIAELSAVQQQASALSQGISAYTAGADSAADACSQLSGQIPQLQSGIESLRSGMSDLSGGISELKTGTSKLAENAPSLTAGIAQASGGAEQIQQQGTLALRRGAADLNDGLGRLGEGAADLKNGTSLLASAASRISAEAGILSDAGKEQAEDTAEMFAAPLEIEEEQITYVADNGHAMAPYMMSVGLWVGCIAFCLMYPLTSCPGKMDSGLKWWFSKASVLVVTAVLQAVVMLAALAVFDGFDPERAGLTALTACAASVAFMSVMYFFTSLLGRVGSFLMLVFMVVQLAGSAGTYPLEISGAFVPYLHGWVPFTYTVAAFRSTISGGEDIGGCLLFLLVLTAVFSVLTALEFKIRAARIRKGGRTLIEWLEAHGLA